MSKTNIIKYKGTKRDWVDISEASVTNTMALADGSGCTVGTLTNDTIGTTAEDGFITITVDGTTAKIPFWYDNA